MRIGTNNPTVWRYSHNNRQILQIHVPWSNGLDNHRYKGSIRSMVGHNNRSHKYILWSSCNSSMELSFCISSLEAASYMYCNSFFIYSFFFLCYDDNQLNTSMGKSHVIPGKMTQAMVGWAYTIGSSLVWAWPKKANLTIPTWENSRSGFWSSADLIWIFLPRSRMAKDLKQRTLRYG